MSMLELDDATNALAAKLLGCSLLQIERPYWAAKIKDAEDDSAWVSEAHWKYDLVNGTKRLTDWTQDLVANDLTWEIRELWMFCPPNPMSPCGNTVRLPIVHPGSA